MTARSDLDRWLAAADELLDKHPLPEEAHRRIADDRAARLETKATAPLPVEAA